MNADDRELLIRVDENVKALLKRGDDHEGRLRVVERRQWEIGGAATVISVLVAYFVKKLGL